ncbi:hypothetical protein [Streptomyces sp. NPDC021622]|uniref:hypothetical protein n=1 Tax=Streptomyces sp. NPDC021622 TaxID=3155013 RepID=UPI0033CBE54D
MRIIAAKRTATLPNRFATALFHFNRLMPHATAVGPCSPHPGDRMKTHLAAALGSIVLTAGTLLGAPAAGAQSAPYPSTPFDVTIGASSVRGTLTWRDRSVEAAGTHRAVGCNRVWFSTYGASGNELGTWSSGTRCNVTYQFNAVAPADVPGGAASVRICLDANTALKCEWYNRP